MVKNKKEVEKSNYAFIDSQNLNLGVRSMGWVLDFKKFRVFLKSQYKVTRAYIFIGYVSRNKRLYKLLKEFGYILVFKPTLRFGEKNCRKTKGNVDAELVLHAMVKWKNYHKAVLVSGDGDFYCLVEYLVKKNKLLRIIVPNYKYSSLFRKFARYILPIPLIEEKVGRKKGAFPRHENLR
jgi:uncharacterized LabA/DUF88 family protein